MIHYLRDFAESFFILFGPFIQMLSGGMFVAGLLLAAALAWLPQITRRL